MSGRSVPQSSLRLDQKRDKRLSKFQPNPVTEQKKGQTKVKMQGFTNPGVLASVTRVLNNRCTRPRTVFLVIDTPAFEVVCRARKHACKCDTYMSNVRHLRLCNTQTTLIFQHKYINQIDAQCV